MTLGAGGFYRCVRRSLCVILMLLVLASPCMVAAFLEAPEENARETPNEAPEEDTRWEDFVKETLGPEEYYALECARERYRERALFRKKNHRIPAPADYDGTYDLLHQRIERPTFRLHMETEDDVEDNEDVTLRVHREPSSLTLPDVVSHMPPYAQEYDRPVLTVILREPHEGNPRE